MPFRSVDRHAAHRHGFAPALAPAGQRDVEDGGGAPRIVEEQLEEIAHAIEKQRAFGLTLQRVILLHHRSVAAGHARARAKPWPIREAVRTRFPRAFPALSPSAYPLARLGQRNIFRFRSHHGGRKTGRFHRARSAVLSRDHPAR
jgi:hypothetical protein